MESESYSRYRRFQGDGLLLKLNHSALNIPVSDEPKPLRFWLDLARRTLRSVSGLMLAGD
jgi:hypothetical protein